MKSNCANSLYSALQERAFPFVAVIFRDEKWGIGMGDMAYKAMDEAEFNSGIKENWKFNEIYVYDPAFERDCLRGESSDEKSICLIYKA